MKASWAWKLFALAGWGLVVAMLCVLAPRVWKRYGLRFSSVHEAAWARTVAQKKADLAANRWKDSRTLHLFAGDSHVELGDWYDLCNGQFAIRNSGLSMAKIENVAELIASISDTNVQTVVFMCGINNLTRGEGVESAVKKYDELLSRTRDKLKPTKIVVASVMPVRQMLGDQANAGVNANVRAFNGRLKELCAKQGAVFVDVNPAISAKNGALSGNLTLDGLHLNSDGYKAIGPILCESLNQNQPTL